MTEKTTKLDRETKTEKIFSMASNRGFFFNTANIYGGKAGFFTYGHLGKSLKNNWESLWKKHFLNLNENFHEIQSNSILPESVFKASGHIENFNDPLVECKKCNSRFRADHILEEDGLEDAEALSLEEMNKEISNRGLKCQKCKGELIDARQFNMMFPIEIGFSGDKAYLSPETAQGAFLTFKDEFFATRSKLPLGLAIVDKAYRNEISPRQGFFRLREFTQAELQIFFDADLINEHKNWKEVENKTLLIKFAGEKEIKEITCKELNSKHKIPKFYIYHASKVQDFYLEKAGVPKEKFRLRELDEKERAFYNKIHFDVEVDFGTLGGFKEVGGVHYRTDHDLTGHQKVSKKNLMVNIEGKKFIPHVLELSFGVDRNVFMLLDMFFDEKEGNNILKLPLKLAPTKVAIFPLVKKDEKLVQTAKDLHKELREEYDVIYDEAGSVGKRYARNDEAGTPFCITVDGESEEDKSITIRNRDDGEQKRVKIDETKDTLRKLISGEIEFKELC
ncbi:MAG: glycine--tRNA ligase [Nanoarchaeota archaeon]|nr:glycine--tRNA ligase [Nanoarchaeota archaeon]